MKITRLITALLVAVAVTGCGHNGHGHDHGHDAHDGGHAHEENFQFTSYNNEFEVFAEVTPFVVGEQSDILAHFSFLKNFKPLESGKVAVSLIVGTDGIRQTMDAPARPGIYRFALTPSTKGRGKMLFDIQTPEGTSQIVVPNVVVYDNKHDAQHAAADAVAESSNGAIFTKEMSWKVDFATEQCNKEPFGQVIRTMAQVAPSQGDERVVTAASSGIIRFSDNSMIDGKSVSAGQTLFFIEGGDMTDNNLSVRYQEAESNYNLTKREYERKSELAKDNIVSESDLLQAKRDYENAESIYNNLRKNFSSGKHSVSSPMGGYVKDLKVRNGQFVEAGQPLATITQNRNLFIKAELQSRYYTALEHISGGNIRLLNNDAVYSLEELEGKVVSYGKSVSADSPLLPVVFQITNSIKLLPGSFVEMYIKTQSNNEVVTVPNDALIEEMGNYFVYVQLTPEFFEKREVKIGATDGKRTEVLSGVNETERVVSKGAVLVKLAQATGALDAHAGHVH